MNVDDAIALDDSSGERRPHDHDGWIQVRRPASACSSALSLLASPGSRLPSRVIHVVAEVRVVKALHNEALAIDRDFATWTGGSGGARPVQSAARQSYWRASRLRMVRYSSMNTSITSAAS